MFEHRKRSTDTQDDIYANDILVDVRDDAHGIYQALVIMCESSSDVKRERAELLRDVVGFVREAIDSLLVSPSALRTKASQAAGEALYAEHSKRNVTPKQIGDITFRLCGAASIAQMLSNEMTAEVSSAHEIVVRELESVIGQLADVEWSLADERRAKLEDNQAPKPIMSDTGIQAADHETNGVELERITDIAIRLRGVVVVSKLLARETGAEVSAAYEIMVRELEGAAGSLNQVERDLRAGSTAVSNE